MTTPAQTVEAMRWFNRRNPAFDPWSCWHLPAGPGETLCGAKPGRTVIRRMVTPRQLCLRCAGRVKSPRVDPSEIRQAVRARKRKITPAIIADAIKRFGAGGGVIAKVKERGDIPLPPLAAQPVNGHNGRAYQRR